MRQPSVRSVLQATVPPLVLFAIIVAVWHFCVQFYGIKRYILPSPWQVGTDSCPACGAA